MSHAFLEAANKIHSVETLLYYILNNVSFLPQQLQAGRESKGERGCRVLSAFLLPTLLCSGLKGRLHTGHRHAPSHHLYIPCRLHNIHAITIILPHLACCPCWKYALFLKFKISSGHKDICFVFLN